MKRLQWLEEQLDRDDISFALRRKYELEADKLAMQLTMAQKHQKEAKEARDKEIAFLREQLQNGNLSAIDTHGIPEFGEEYEIVREGNSYVVYSRAAREDQNDRHVFTDYESANSKYRKLIWDRLYHKYVRTGEVEHLSKLIN